MLFLIAESKTMSGCDIKRTPEDWAKNTPLTQVVAEEIMCSLRSMSASQLSAVLNVSEAMGRRLHEWIYDFPNRGSAGSAMESFTGVVFKAFDYNSLHDDKDFAACNVRILSSLYGYLRPNDLVKPYRFDYGTRLAPDKRKFADYWKERVTELICEEIKDVGGDTIVDLLPRDAARMVEWERVDKKAKVVRIDFRDVKDGGSVVTPHSARLKALRGDFLREAIMTHATSIHDLIALDSEKFIYSPESSTPDTLIFLT